jgi:hypothetical protein
MRFILVTLFLLISFLGFGQTVSAPDPKSFLQSTNGQDASGFVLNGFGATETLLASISLVNPPTGTTFYLDRLDGLTPASGFTLPGNKTRLVVTGTMANINIALANLKINTGAIKGNVQISVAATVNPVGFFYNGVNGHFYRPLTATADRTTYTNARSRSLATTFKGQQGYLVTITSTSEEEFIRVNVPATNVWFAATDEVIDGRWVIDAGPEKGTLMKTSNGQTAGNIQGVYNNWCPGEPNGSNGSENYAVAKWNGAACWNDLSNNWNNPYVIEYGTWTNPDDATFTEFYTNSVIHSNGDVLRAQFNFEFGQNINETQFTAILLAQNNSQYTPTTNINRTLNGLGRVDMTSDLDTLKISSGGIRATTTTGQVEWCVIYEYEASNQRYRIGIDSREVNGIVSNPSTINNLQLFDLWNGPVTFNSYDPNGWTEVYVYTSTPFNFSGSSFASFIRAGNGFYGLRAEFGFSSTQNYKQHGIELNTTNVATLYNNIVTVSDVFLAFKEVSNKGLLGNENGLEFGSGVQFMNADVDGNGMFNEADTYQLIQHLTGSEIIGNGSNNLSDYMKILPKSEYDAITKLNWNTKPNSTTNTYFPINLSTTSLLNTFTYDVFWKGDVNMSHSALQANNARIDAKTSSEINAYIISEVINNKVIVTITLDPLQEAVVGTQFQLNYDNTKLKFETVEFKTKGNPTNYGNNRGNFINIGSLITNGAGILDNTTEYKIIFTLLNNTIDILGLTSISKTDAVNSNGIQLNIKVK